MIFLWRTVLKPARCWFHYFYLQYGNTSLRTLSRGVWTRDLFRFFEIQPEEVMTSKRSWKKKLHEKGLVFCAETLLVSHIMIFSSATTASRYGVTVWHLVTCDRIGYTIGRYFTTCSLGVLLMFLHISFNEEDTVSSVWLKGCLAIDFPDLLARKWSRWNAMHVCRLVPSFLVVLCWRCFNDPFLQEHSSWTRCRSDHILD